MTNPTLQSKLLKLIEDIPPAPYSEQRMRTESFGDGQECENARLQPILKALIECVDLFAMETAAQHCVCKLNELVAGLIPCETCHCRSALARIEALVKETE